MSLKHLIGRVKENCSNDVKGFKGLDLIALQIDNDEKLLVIRPIKLEQMEEFYRTSYENGMKEMISDDYEYCVWYLADEECELQCSININELDIIRELTKEDIEDHDKNFEEFKRIHKFDERRKKLEEEERQEKIALEEFKKEKKSEFELSLKDGTCKIVDAVVYKGFAIHDGINCNDENIFKNVTIYEGKYKGRKLVSCNVAKYKNMIDEIRVVIGNKEIKESDAKKIQEIISKY